MSATPFDIQLAAAVVVAEAGGESDPRAIHEAVKRLNSLNHQRFAFTLFHIVSPRAQVDDVPFYEVEMSFINATAAQRAEALLRTIGKWRDE